MTDEYTLVIIREKKSGRKSYRRVYNDGSNYTNNIIVGVEVGQNECVVTCMLPADEKRDKKAAMREFKKRISSFFEILYIKEEKVWEGLSGHSRPTSRTQTSQINADLHPSGNFNVAQGRTEGKMQKRQKDASVSTEPESSKKPSESPSIHASFLRSKKKSKPEEKAGFGFTKDPDMAFDTLLRTIDGKRKSNESTLSVKA